MSYLEINTMIDDVIIGELVPRYDWLNIAERPVGRINYIQDESQDNTYKLYRNGGRDMSTWSKHFD